MKWCFLAVKTKKDFVAEEMPILIAGMETVPVKSWQYYFIFIEKLDAFVPDPKHQSYLFSFGPYQSC